MRAADTTQDTSDLTGLDDPALITRWAAARNELALTSRDSPRHADVKRAYDAALAEYRRRVTGQAAP
jgi:hypothetical protein